MLHRISNLRIRSLGVLSVIVMACGGKSAPVGECAIKSTGESANRELAACLATGNELAGSRQPSASPSTVLFIDRSKSMRGFLDPEYPTRIATDYRSVIDRLIVGLRPSAGYSFGAEVRSIEPTLGTLGRRDFYNDTDTRIEDALKVVGRDSTRTANYLFVGDGRRGSPELADAQFVQLRALAQRWIDGGGSFVVGASLAPFKTVPEDPSGCRSNAGDDARQTCPLYAFAFVAKGGQEAVASTLSQMFEHVFAWPVNPGSPGDYELRANSARADVRFERRWHTGPAGTPIVRSRGPKAVTNWLPVSVGVTDTVDVRSRGLQAVLTGQGFTLRLHSKRFAADAKSQSWKSAEKSGVVRASPESPLEMQAITRGVNSEATIYRLDLVPSGVPTWLDAMDAANAGDRIRTYGLGRLFELFRQRASEQVTTDSAAIARFFWVAQ